MRGEHPQGADSRVNAPVVDLDVVVARGHESLRLHCVGVDGDDSVFKTLSIICQIDRLR
jgi:hypothetical protein